MATETAMEKREGQVVQPEMTRGGPTYRPNVDIIEKDDELLLLADLPGTKADSIDIDYERGELSIYARIEPRQSPKAIYLLREYGVGDFHRTFRVGEAIDVNRIEAEVKNGVLTLHLPKVEAARPRKIKVSGS